MAASERMATDNTLKAVQGAIERVADAISNSKTGVVYGFHIKKNESSPSGAVTYLRDAVGATPAPMDYTNDVFNYGSWENAFFMPRPCMLKSDGTVDYYLNPNDVSKKEDGTASDIGDASYDGNAMVEWGQNGKKIWLKVVPDVDNLGASVYIADYQADADFHDYPFHNAAGQSMDHFYTAMFRGHLDSNNKLRSLSGKAVMKTKPAADEVTYAKANNPTGKQMWNIDLHSDLFLINCLLILMGKSLDMQTVYGQGLVNSGSEAINDLRYQRRCRCHIHECGQGILHGELLGLSAQAVSWSCYGQRYPEGQEYLRHGRRLDGIRLQPHRGRLQVSRCNSFWRQQRSGRIYQGALLHRGRHVCQEYGRRLEYDILL